MDRWPGRGRTGRGGRVESALALGGWQRVAARPGRLGPPGERSGSGARGRPGLCRGSWLHPAAVSQRAERLSQRRRRCRQRSVPTEESSHGDEHLLVVIGLRPGCGRRCIRGPLRILQQVRGLQRAPRHFRLDLAQGEWVKADGDGRRSRMSRDDGISVRFELQGCAVRMCARRLGEAVSQAEAACLGAGGLRSTGFPEDRRAAAGHGSKCL